MTNITEGYTYDAGVYQLATTDPVAGGPSGVSNAPLINLTNRTGYLKTHMDLLESGATIPPPVAPLASPVFTGNPTAPTPALGDNDFSLATTGFVQGTVGGRLVLSVAGGINVTLTAVQAGNAILEFTGALTANISVIVPISPTRPWIAYNNTSGAYSLTVKTSAGTGVVVRQTKRSLLYVDGTNVVHADQDILPELLLVAGAGSGLDSDLLDGQHGSYYMPITSIGSYAPSLTGSGASGNWGINITGNAATAPWSGISSKPTTIAGYGISDWNSYAPSLTGTGASGTAWGIGITGNAATASAVAWSGVSSKPTTVAGYGISDIGSYAPSLTGAGASGSWGIGITGNAATASTAATCSGNSASATTASACSGNAATASAVAWTGVSSKPTTVAGYGISDWNSYSPSLTGSGASGSAWGIGITGNAATSSTSGTCSGNAATASAVAWSGVSSKPTTVAGYGISDIGSYAPSLTGAGASGSWGISVTGNAASASSVGWSGVSSKPTTVSGYGISDIGSYAPSLTGSGANGSGWAIGITGNAATATTAASCSGNSATATTAAACSGNAATASAVTWTAISGKPTTTAGFGITDGFAQGQTWQDMTYARSWNVVYQNTSGKPIMVSVTGQFIYQTWGTCVLHCGPTSSPPAVSGIIAAKGDVDQMMTLIVPNGSYYEIVNTTGSVNLLSWFELF